MTFAILARDAETGDIGAAVATGTPAVGGFVLHFLPGTGGLATQGYSTNTLYGPRGLRLLGEKMAAPEVCHALTAADAGRDWRQLVVIDEAGRTSGWTGARNVKSMLHLCEPNLAVAGNWLASQGVVTAMREAYLGASSQPLIFRLLAALEAGDAAGSDSRGAQSAAVVVTAYDRPPLDLRVDFDERPIARLRQIQQATEAAEFQAFLNRLPTLSDPMRY